VEAPSTSATYLGLHGPEALDGHDLVRLGLLQGALGGVEAALGGAGLLREVGHRLVEVVEAALDVGDFAQEVGLLGRCLAHQVPQLSDPGLPGRERGGGRGWLLARVDGGPGGRGGAERSAEDDDHEAHTRRTTTATHPRNPKQHQ
jgi:hypothetical protein